MNIGYLPKVLTLSWARLGFARYGGDMPLTISDEELTAVGLSEAEARLEIACRLYDAGKLTMPRAASFAGISRTEFETALIERGLPLIRLGELYWQQELEGMQRLGW